MATPAAASTLGPGAAVHSPRYLGAVGTSGPSRGQLAWFQCLSGPLSVYLRLCVVKTTFTAAQPGFSVTQRQEPVNWESFRYPG